MDEDKYLRALAIIICISLATSCVHIRSGSFINEWIADVKLNGDQIVILYARQHIESETTVFSHTSKHDKKILELYIGVVEPSELVHGYVPINFSKVGEFTKDPHGIGINIDDGLKLVSAGRLSDCSNYSGSCIENVLDISEDDLYAEISITSKVVVENKQVEIGIDHSKNNRIRVTYLGDSDIDRISRAIKLTNSGSVLPLIIIKTKNRKSDRSN
jgi:hypothetical protein